MYSSASEYIRSVASSSLCRVSFSKGAEGQRTENMVGVSVVDGIVADQRVRPRIIPSRKAVPMPCQNPGSRINSAMARVQSSAVPWARTSLSSGVRSAVASCQAFSRSVSRVIGSVAVESIVADQGAGVKPPPR